MTTVCNPSHGESLIFSVITLSHPLVVCQLSTASSTHWKVPHPLLSTCPSGDCRLSPDVDAPGHVRSEWDGAVCCDSRYRVPSAGVPALIRSHSGLVRHWCPLRVDVVHLAPPPPSSSGGHVSARGAAPPPPAVVDCHGKIGMSVYDCLQHTPTQTCRLGIVNLNREGNRVTLDVNISCCTEDVCFKDLI